MTNLEQKYNVHSAFNCLNKRINKFNLDWEFSADEAFDRIAQTFIKEHGVLNKEVFYIMETDVDAKRMDAMKDGESIDFSSHSILEKKGNYYLYHIKSPIVFGVHVHLDFNEEITPLDCDIVMYVIAGVSYKKVDIKVGETYHVPKGMKHAALFSKTNTIKIYWKK